MISRCLGRRLIEAFENPEAADVAVETLDDLAFVMLVFLQVALVARNREAERANEATQEARTAQREAEANHQRAEQERQRAESEREQAQDNQATGRSTAGRLSWWTR